MYSPFSPLCCIGYLRIRRRGASQWRGEDCADFPDKSAPPRPDTAHKWPGFPDFRRPCCSPCARSRPGSSYLCWYDGPVACLLLPHTPASSSPAVTLITHGFGVWRQQLLLYNTASVTPPTAHLILALCIQSCSPQELTSAPSPALCSCRGRCCGFYARLQAWLLHVVRSQCQVHEY